MNTRTTIDDAAAQGADRVEQLATGVQQIAEQATQSASSALHAVGERGKALGQQLSERQKVWAEDARGCVRNHPLVSVAIAVGAGLLLSRLLSR